MGYVYENTISRKHWYQLADDTAIVTVLELDNQLLLNLSQSGPTGHGYQSESKSFILLECERHTQNQNGTIQRYSLIAKKYRLWKKALSI